VQLNCGTEKLTTGVILKPSMSSTSISTLTCTLVLSFFNNASIAMPNWWLVWIEGAPALPLLVLSGQIKRKIGRNVHIPRTIPPYREGRSRMYTRTELLREPMYRQDCFNELYTADSFEDDGVYLGNLGFLHRSCLSTSSNCSRCGGIHESDIAEVA